MALGEDAAEVEASAGPKAVSYRRCSCGEPEGDTPGPVSREQPHHLEAEGGPIFPVWGAEEPPAPACPSGAYQPQTSDAHRELVADGPEPAPHCLHPPASTGGDLLHSVGSQMEESKLSTSGELPQTLTLPRTTALCSGHNADTENDPSPDDWPQVLDLSQQPHNSGFPFPSWQKAMVSRGATVPQLSTCNISASSMGSSFQSQQEKVEPQNCSLAKASSSQKLVVPQERNPSVVGLGPQFKWSPQPVVSGGDAPGLGQRRLSFQAEYWACVLPDTLPPSPDRQSPLWNPNKEYEDLLDYTYPLRPGPQLPKHLDSRVLTDPVLQDSGVDLDSFSASPASTLKSPTNVSPSCLPAESTALPFSGSREPSIKCWPSGVPQKRGSMGLASCSQLTSTPRAPGSRDAPWESREPALREKDWPHTGKHLEVGSPQLRKQDRGWPSSRTENQKKASPSIWHPVYAESRWKAEEEVESDDEYLALPARLTQVSSLVSYLGSVPTLVTLPTRAAKGQSSLEVSDSDGPASFPSDSSQSQLPPGAALRRPGETEGQNHCFLRSIIRARDSAEEGSLVNSQALGVTSGLLKTHPSLPAMLDPWSFSAPSAEGQLPRRGGEQGEESLVQCVKTFCCQLEELICWLYNVADITDHRTLPRSNLTGLKSSLQLYRQFKKDIDEHQSLTESVLQKGEILLQCLLDNTPALKDVLGRIAKQSGELESHADRLYESILVSLDMLAGCTLMPDKKPMAAEERSCEGVQPGIFSGRDVSQMLGEEKNFKEVLARTIQH
ncbi:centrosomal protein of 68 kDa [Nycticebus coucang]|uniref:centrosomal protein of 68 kDa n=1 Tax=Nycticebus coucang TaxID=9470 RepID=UPI00234DBC04|nr:centrosomal protein of 68 kDa [Nycticebus coucang]XP_053442816.1 centrosomal protein of 68 kDa [Nycticebus coucang]